MPKIAIKDKMSLGLALPLQDTSLKVFDSVYLIKPCFLCVQAFLLVCPCAGILH